MYLRLFMYTCLIHSLYVMAEYNSYVCFIGHIYYASHIHYIARLFFSYNIMVKTINYYGASLYCKVDSF